MRLGEATIATPRCLDVRVLLPSEASDVATSFPESRWAAFARLCNALPDLTEHDVKENVQTNRFNLTTRGAEDSQACIAAEFAGGRG